VDEVLAVGDASFQAKCLATIGKLASQGRAVLLVSHNLQSLQKLSSRGILLDNGGAVTDGPIQETLEVYGQLRED
jgi:lipopolysaccharide transport system ATP-binding protein